ncbi:MAG TPA: hypothetical protein VK544_05455 [Gemmatimonadaceae bacterium]|nr:hypothetical protein [Gemmatimonadaceae bacterium]
MARAPFAARTRWPARNLIALISLCAIAAASACATVEPVIVAEPGVAFSLPIGKTATINGDGTKITFRRVTQESRCPTDVTCVWAGDATIEVIISRTGSPDDTATITLRTPYGEKSSGNLLIRFVGLTPVPRQADGNAPRAYVAELVVNRT